MAERKKRFPVLGGGMTIPWVMLEPHEPQAVRNHDQTLERLAERGGLGWAELLCVLEARPWDSRNWMADEVAKPRVLALVAAFEDAPLRAELALARKALAAAEELAAKVRALKADDNSWTKETEMYDALPAFDAAMAEVRKGER